MSNTLDESFGERLDELLQDNTTSQFIKAAILLLNKGAAHYNCRIRLPIIWRDMLRDAQFLQTLLKEDLFFYLAQAIEPRFFLNRSKFKGVEEMVKSRIAVEVNEAWEPIYCCSIGLDGSRIAWNQIGFPQFFSLQALPMKIQVIKGNFSRNILQFNSYAIRKIRVTLTDYAHYLFQLNNSDSQEFHIFTESYFIISEYNPGHNLVLKEKNLTKSYEHMVDMINQLQLQTFNKNYFLVEIIGPKLNLWVCFYTHTHAFRLELLYGADLTLLSNDLAYYEFSSHVAMFIELARLEFSSWRLPTVVLQ